MHRFLLVCNQKTISYPGSTQAINFSHVDYSMSRKWRTISKKKYNLINTFRLFSNEPKTFPKNIFLHCKINNCKSCRTWENGFSLGGCDYSTVECFVISVRLRTISLYLTPLPCSQMANVFFSLQKFVKQYEKDFKKLVSLT